MNSTESTLSKPRVEKQSTVVRDAPRLNRQGLSIMLSLMCLVPVITIILLWRVLPPVQPGKLQAGVWLQDVPPLSYYESSPRQRVPRPLASVVIKNMGQEVWTHLNIRVNRHFQVYEHEFPVEPGQERAFLLDRFVTRTGDSLDVGVTRVKNVEIYARLPSGSRATFDQDF